MTTPMTRDEIVELIAEAKLAKARETLDGIRQWYACSQDGDSMPEALYDTMLAELGEG